VEGLYRRAGSAKSIRWSARNDGALWIDCQVTRVELGGEPSVLLILDDVTDQKRTEDSLLLTQISVDRRPTPSSGWDPMLGLCS